MTLGCRRGTEQAVGERARREGVGRIVTFGFAGGLRPATDVADVRALRTAIAAADVVHVHRGKEHWLAVVAARLAEAGRSCARGTSRRRCDPTPATAGSTAAPPRSWWP